MNSNTYYFELATLLYDHFGIDLYQKVFHGKYYLTVHDYLIGRQLYRSNKKYINIISKSAKQAGSHIVS